MQRLTKQKIKDEYDLKTASIEEIDGIRIVHPYEFSYKLYTKERWLGWTIPQVFAQEFLQHTAEYVIDKITSGFLPHQRHYRQ